MGRSKQTLYEYEKFKVFFFWNHQSDFRFMYRRKNLSTQNEEDLENAELGLSTDFSLKTERSISITATDGEGKTQKGVKMGIFASQPYTGEGIISVEPILLDIQMLPVN